MSKLDKYSPLGKIFNKGLSGDDKKEGLFKRLKNIADKNKEQLKRLSNTNKTSYIKNKRDYNYDNNFAFHVLSFTEIFKILRIGHSSLNTMI